MTSSLVQFWEHFNKSYAQVESFVGEHENSYKGLAYEALYTSKEDLDIIFSDPFINGIFLDLGCGQGQSVLYYALKFPEREALGIENEKPRFDFALKAKLDFAIDNSDFIYGDLLNCSIPKADTYFLYFPTGHVLDRVLTELYEQMNFFYLVVIESHGDLIGRIEKENWLIFSHALILSSKRHYPFAKVYKRSFDKRSSKLLPFQNSFLKRYILIQENELSWIGDTFQMEWIGDDLFNLKVPPRTIRWDDVKKLMDFDEFDPLVKLAINLRESGELDISLQETTIHASIRKIYVEPTFMIELSSGQRLKWSEIIFIFKGSLKCYESSFFV